MATDIDKLSSPGSRSQKASQAYLPLRNSLNSQISTSKKPTTGARYLSPLDTNITRNVPMLTSAILATNTRNGTENHV